MAMSKNVIKGKVPVKNKNTEQRAWSDSALTIASMISLVIVTIIVFSPCFKAGFINWDEKRYLFETPMVQQLNWENIKAIFSEKVLLSYNPLVVLSFAIDYSFVAQKPEWYHVLNVLLHVANTLLLFMIIRKLTGKISFAIFTAFFFALHPLHVESVAWIASRKDVLYTCFYFLSWLFYLNYFTAAKKKFNYFLALFFFLLSLLSKSQAVTLPVVLLLSQWYVLHTQPGEKQTWKKSYLLELLPFFIFSIAIGFFTLQGAAASADKYAAPLSFSGKIMYSVIAAGIYMYKAFLPMNQSAIYAFPEMGSQAFLLQLSIAIILIAASLGIGWRTRNTNPGILFGVAFFYVHIFLILHILATNSSLIYERFSYVAYTGLFFAVLSAGQAVKNAKAKNNFRIALVAVLVIFSVATYARCKIWNDPETLWSDVIEKNPASDAAYNNRGEYYYNRGEFDKAIADYTSSIGVNPHEPHAYNNRSVIYLAQKRYPEALQDNNEALKIEPDFTAAYNNRGNIYFNTAQYDSAIVYFARATQREPGFAAAWCNLGSSWLQKGNLQEALKYYRKTVEINPVYDEAFRYMGIAYLRMDSLGLAKQYLSRAQQINPQNDALKVLSDDYLRRGSEAFKTNHADQALEYYSKAAEVNPSDAEAYYCIGGAWFAKGDIPKAREFWKRTLQIDPNHKDAKMWLGRIGN
jgi:tetratricopeptide (TPR) repeat protein